MKTLTLEDWRDFGKYRQTPDRMKDIIRTGEGRSWVRWMSRNSYNMSIHPTVLERINELEYAER
jgi:hypothetical protein